MDIVQISDFHCVAPGERAYGRVDTVDLLRGAVGSLNRLTRTPDLVVGSGDLVQSGRSEEYAALRAILADLAIPFLPCLGNHDARGPFKAAFADLDLPWGPEPFAQYAVAHPGLRLIVLDTVTEGSDQASFCPERAAWLEETLAKSSTPALIVTHHPPFWTDIPWMDPPSLNWTLGLEAAVRRFQNRVAGVISGHIHRAIHTIFAGVPASSCPSTAHQVAFDLTATRPTLSFEAPGFQRHLWDGTRLTTHTASFERLDATFHPSAPGRADDA
jgi:3',5'-cyclic AMP phosphodiesterase CpdA